MTDTFTSSACQFVERTPTGDQYTYTRVTTDTPNNTLHMATPPRIGDKIALGEHVYLVLGVMHQPPQIGSQVWPWEDGLTEWAMMVEILVRRSIGFYINEAT